jgi:hypothetical protein
MERENLSPTVSSQIASSVRGIEPDISSESNTVGRRSFLKGLGIVGATLLPARALLIVEANAQDKTSWGKLTKGDADLLR